jgi:hypothetical protein
VASGAVEAALAPCQPGEVVVGLALGEGPGGPTAYLSLWRSTTADTAAAPSEPGGGRLRAVDVASGAVVAEAPLVGVPAQLVVAAAPGAAGPRLYCVEGLHSTGAGGDALVEADRADRWLVRGLDPLTLAPESRLALPARPCALAVAADGDAAYVLAGPGPRRSSTELVRLDLRRGAVRTLGSVPGSGAGGLAVVGDRLYVPVPEGDGVAVVDRRSGRPLPAAHAGRGPIGIAVAGER